MDPEYISKSLITATMAPLDAKQIAKTLAELKDLGTENNKAFTYYDGMRVLCLEDRNLYEWKEIAYGETGLIPGGYAYPPDTIVNETNYSNLLYNFVLVASSNTGGGGTGLTYVEPSVNIEFKESSTPVQAMYFGKLDIGAGLQDVALVKNDFVAQSNFDMLSGINQGAEIKLHNASNNSYLGHFVISGTTYSGFRVLTIIEKGNWTPLGDYNAQTIYLEVLKESAYTINLNGNVIEFFKGITLVDSVDLNALLAGATNATIVSGVLNPANGIVTFTLSDASTFDVDFSALLTAQTTVRRGSLLAPNGGSVYENLFVARASHAIVGKGFYAADLNTDYNSTTILGFPYPTNRSFICFRYGNQLYCAVPKSTSGFRIFNKPDQVLGLSVFKFTNTTDKHTTKVAYIKLLTRKATVAGLNSNYVAFPIWLDQGTNFPDFSVSGTPNETYLLNGTNEANGYVMISKIYDEVLPLRKTVTVPYTLTAEDNGRILYAGGSGAITIPTGLPRGFWCGIVQTSASTAILTVAALAGVTLNKPDEKKAELTGQYFSAMIEDMTEWNFAGVVGTATANTFLLAGDLENV